LHVEWRKLQFMKARYSFNGSPGTGSRAVSKTVAGIFLPERGLRRFNAVWRITLNGWKRARSRPRFKLNRRPRAGIRLTQTVQTLKRNSDVAFAHDVSGLRCDAGPFPGARD
jgi:hypothetical protein